MPNAACGLPDAAGASQLIEGGTYNLTDDCTQVKELLTQSATTDVIIRGNGHTIYVAPDQAFMTVNFNGGANLVMENVTLDNQGGGRTFLSMIVVNSPRTITLTNVTLQNHQGYGGVYITNEDGHATSTITSTLTNITFKGFRNPNDGNFPTYVRSLPLFTIGEHIVVNVNGCRFIDNESKDRAPLYAWDRSTINVHNGVFRDNKAAAHIMARGGTVNMSGNIVFSGTGTTVDFTDRRLDLETDDHAGTIIDNRTTPSDEGQSDTDEDSAPLIEAKPTGVWDSSSSCGTLPREIEAIGYHAGTQCQRVDAVGLGNAEVAAAGFRDGVDVWGWAPAGMRVCWRVASGSFKFIDTSVMPRTVEDLPAHSYNGMTCTTINRVGMVALLPGSAPAGAAPPPETVAPMSTAIPRQSLSGCMVRANYLLNLRDAPAGNVIGAVAYEAKLTAVSRTPGWFEVDNNGVTGWIAAMYIEPIGACG